MPTIAIRTDDLVLEGHLVLATQPRAAVVLLHGIPGGQPDPADPGYAGLASTFAGRGYSALHFDFRGVRGTAGDFSFDGWQQDLRAALDALDTADTKGLPKIVVGSSAGGAVAITTCSERADVVAVATLAAPASFEPLTGDVETSLARFRNLGIIHDPGFPNDPAEWGREMTDGAPERHAGRISPRPLLIVHGDADTVVPYPHAERLFAAARDPKEIIRIPAGAHQLRKDPRAVDAVLDWADNLRLGAVAPPV